MLLRDNKGNLFEMDEMLTGATPRVKEAEKEDCQSCPHQGMCQEEEEYSEGDNRLLFFEISTN